MRSCIASVSPSSSSPSSSILRRRGETSKRSSPLSVWRSRSMLNRARGGPRARHQPPDLGGRELDREHAVLGAVAVEDLAERGRDHAADPHPGERPDRHLARAPAAEVLAAHEDPRRAPGLAVEDEVRVLAAAGQVAQRLERPAPELGLRRARAALICHKTACAPGSQPRPGSILARGTVQRPEARRNRAHFRGTDAKEFPILILEGDEHQIALALGPEAAHSYPSFGTRVSPPGSRQRRPLWVDSVEKLQIAGSAKFCRISRQSEI
jgi:hypothetical protein